MLTLDLSLNVLVPLEDLVVLSVPNLKSLLHLGILFLYCGVHLIFLSRYEDILCR